MITYADALRAIFRRTDYERGNRPTTAYAERVWRLDRVRELLQALGNPQDHYRAVHVAGTKGKGSTTAMVESVLRTAGYRTGMYTSPHLHTFRERIRVASEPVSEETVCELVERLRPVLSARPEVTVFETITAMAMLHFAEQGVQWGVFEVGMGGRLDATNILHPDVSVITSISLDHTQVLGETIAAIAREKAGIIKEGIPVVSSPQRPEALEVIAARAEQAGAPLVLVGRDWCCAPGAYNLRGQELSVYRTGHHARPEYPQVCIPLLGLHQVENAATAVAAIEVLRERGVSLERLAVVEGMASVNWPGRLEVLCTNPLLVVDGAHNGDSARRLLEAIRRHVPGRSMRLVFGSGTTHEPRRMLEVLLPHAQHTYLVRSQHAKAATLEDLLACTRELGRDALLAGTVADAVNRALDEAGEDDLVLVTGSLFVVAEARAAWAQRRGLPPLSTDPPDVY